MYQYVNTILILHNELSNERMFNSEYVQSFNEEKKIR